MNILFVCKYNRFRSRIAAEYFNKVNKNKKNKAKSAGVIKGSPLDPVEVAIAKDLGINIQGTPKGLTTQLLKWQNMIVIVANDVPKELFQENEKYGKKLLVWNVPDSESDNKAEIERIIRSIMSHVNVLEKELR